MSEQYIMGWILQDISQEAPNYLKRDPTVNHYSWYRYVGSWSEEAEIFFTRHDIIQRLTELQFVDRTSGPIWRKLQVEKWDPVLVVVPIWVEEGYQVVTKTLGMSVLLGRLNYAVYDLLWKQPESGLEIVEKQNRLQLLEMRKT